MTDPGLQTLAQCAVVLFFKTIMTAGFQGYHRLTTKIFVTPEDARVFGTGTPAAAEVPGAQRGALAFRNDAENIPIFLALALIYVMVGAWPAGASFYFWTFTGARIAHTVSYLGGLQPWRTLSYTVGVLCVGAMCIHILAAI